MTQQQKKPPLLGIPTNLSLTEIMQRQGHVPKTDEQIRSVREKLKLAAQEQVRQTTNIPSPRDDSIKLAADTEIDDSFAVLPISSIDFYEHNPRKASNEAFNELKENIRINNIMSPLTVTKRPNSNNYILYAGGNTRLLAIKQLFAETGDPKFETTRVIIKAWRGEVAVMLAHMAENTQRSDMSFWDKANGILEIKRQMETDLGVELGLREFEKALLKEGIQVGRNLINRFIYANNKLAPIGSYLTGLAVHTIQPRVNALIRLCSLYNISEDEFNSNIFNKVLNNTAEHLRELEHANSLVLEKNEATFSVEKFLRDIDHEVCVRCELLQRDLNKMLSIMGEDNKLSLAELQEAIKPRIKPETSPSTYRKSVLTPNIELDEVTSVDEIEAESSFESTEPELAHEVSNQPQEVTIQTVSSNPLARLKIKIQELVIAAQLGGCYVELEAMPLGYYMQFDHSGPLDLQENATDAQAAWWVLVFASGQLDPDLCKAALPENCEWRQLTEDRHPQYSTIDSLDIAIQNNIGGTGAYLQVPWLFAYDNPIAALSLDVIVSLRALEAKVGAK